jgi:hypothetical protein
MPLRSGGDAVPVEPWEPPGAKAEAGLIAAQQRGRAVRFDADGVGEARWMPVDQRPRSTARDSAKSNGAITQTIQLSSNQASN